MGYSLLRFVRPVDQHLRCPICSHVLESPVLTQCGHTFCRTCLLTWLAQSGIYTHPHTDPDTGTTTDSVIEARSTPSSLYSPSLRGEAETQPPVLDGNISQSLRQSQINSDIAHGQGVGGNASWPGIPDNDNHSGTCPECRSVVSVGELSQIICLRNLILSLEVTCENSDRGCPAHFPLERSEVHLQTCDHAPVSCCGCQGMINRAELTSHHLTCAGLRRILLDDYLGDSRRMLLDDNPDDSRGTELSQSGPRSEMSQPGPEHEYDSFDPSSAGDAVNIEDRRPDGRASLMGARSTSLETDLSRFETRIRSIIREEDSYMHPRRGRYYTSPLFTPRPQSDINHSSIKTDADAPQQSYKTFSLDRLDPIQRPSADRFMCTVEAATFPDDPDLARLSPTRLESSPAGGPVSRGQSVHQTSQALAARTQASCAAQVSRLLTRIGALETQVGKLLDDLQQANSKNSLLNIQYRRIQKELLVTRTDKEIQTAGDTYLENGVNSQTSQPTQTDIDKLSATLAQNLLAKPAYIDSTRVFRQLRACYVDTFLSAKRHVIHDVHVLLATAYASNWFSPAQRASLGLWLQHVLLTGRLSRSEHSSVIS